MFFLIVDDFLKEFICIFVINLTVVFFNEIVTENINMSLVLFVKHKFGLY